MNTKYVPTRPEGQDTIDRGAFKFRMACAWTYLNRASSTEQINRLLGIDDRSLLPRMAGRRPPKKVDPTKKSRRRSERPLPPMVLDYASPLRPNLKAWQLTSYGVSVAKSVLGPHADRPYRAKNVADWVTPYRHGYGVQEALLAYLSTRKIKGNADALEKAVRALVMEPEIDVKTTEDIELAAQRRIAEQMARDQKRKNPTHGTATANEDMTVQDEQQKHFKSREHKEEKLGLYIPDAAFIFDGKAGTAIRCVEYEHSLKRGAKLTEKMRKICRVRRVYANWEVHVYINGTDRDVQDYRDELEELVKLIPDEARQAELRSHIFFQRLQPLDFGKKH